MSNLPFLMRHPLRVSSSTHPCRSGRWDRRSAYGQAGGRRPPMGYAIRSMSTAIGANLRGPPRSQRGGINRRGSPRYQGQRGALPSVFSSQFSHCHSEARAPLNRQNGKTVTHADSTVNVRLTRAQLTLLTRSSRAANSAARRYSDHFAFFTASMVVSFSRIPLSRLGITPPLPHQGFGAGQTYYQPHLGRGVALFDQNRELRAGRSRQVTRFGPSVISVQRYTFQLPAGIFVNCRSVLAGVALTHASADHRLHQLQNRVASSRWIRFCVKAPRRYRSRCRCAHRATCRSTPSERYRGACRTSAKAS